jgi:uncharacterized membrane protein YbjE (DUF340 family)
VKQQKNNRALVFILVHCAIMIVIMFLDFSTISHKKDCYTKLFDAYVSYATFNRYETIYLLVSNFLFGVLRKSLAFWLFLLYELSLVMLIYVHWQIYVCP